MSRFCFCNCPAGFSAAPERHAPDCPGRFGAGKAPTPVPATLPASKPVDSCVDFGIDGRSVRVSQEAYSIFLEREAAGREKIAALQQRLTVADERADVLETKNKRLDLMVSQADYNYDADRMQFKARIDVLEGLLSKLWHVVPNGYKSEIDAALKPAEGFGDE